MRKSAVFLYIMIISTFSNSLRIFFFLNFFVSNNGKITTPDDAQIKGVLMRETELANYMRDKRQYMSKIQKKLVSISPSPPCACPCRPS